MVTTELSQQTTHTFRSIQQKRNIFEETQTQLPDQRKTRYPTDPSLDEVLIFLTRIEMGFVALNDRTARILGLFLLLVYDGTLHIHQSTQ